MAVLTYRQNRKIISKEGVTIIRFYTIYNGNPHNCVQCALNRNCQIMQRFKCVFKPMQTFKNPKMPYIYVINLSRYFLSVVFRRIKRRTDKRKAELTPNFYKFYSANTFFFPFTLGCMYLDFKMINFN